VFGLLAGNACVVKASSKNYKQTEIVCRAFTKISEQFTEMKPYVNVVTYGRESQQFTEYFSSICNVRVIWGGDRTIEMVRTAKTHPRVFDISFSDRYSLAVIDSSKIIEAADDRTVINKLAQDFYNDTYLYDQNACSSPRLIYWLGNRDQAETAQKIFWEAVYENIKDRYPIQGEVAVNKMIAVDKTAIEIPGSYQSETPDNKIVRISIPTLDRKLPDLRCSSGLYHEYISNTLDDLVKIVEEKYQTITYFGADSEKIKTFVISNGLRGIDRIVPIGKAADMIPTWDGYDLIETMSRIIAVL
jgi:hypothetical protein